MSSIFTCKANDSFNPIGHGINGVTSDIFAVAILASLAVLFAPSTSLIFYFSEYLQQHSSILIALLIAAFIGTFLFSALQALRFECRVSSSTVIMKTGALFVKEQIIPRKNIRHLTMKTSFVERYFGISTVLIYTSGSSGVDCTIKGLHTHKAQHLIAMLSPAHEGSL